MADAKPKAPLTDKKPATAKGKKGDTIDVLPIVPTTGLSRFTFPSSHPNPSYYQGQWLLVHPTPATPRTPATPGPPRKVRHGSGVYFHLGSTYTGQWSHDAMEGAGQLTFPSGACYQGHFHANRYEGQGSYRWPDGAHYEGEWREGHMHGQGMLTLPSGQSWQGQFAHDNFHNEGGHWQAPPVPLHFL